MLNIAIRNCRVFLRDRASVFFSFMAVFIIIGLYVLFLGDIMKQSVANMSGGSTMMDNWIMAGTIAASTFTTTLGALGIMVEDRSLKIRKDFDASPMRRTTITGGYLVSAVMLGVLLCTVTFALAEGYIVLNGGALLPFLDVLKVFGVITLSVLASSSMLFFVVSYVKTANAFGGLSSIAGTLIGFITGIYIPIGSLPAPVAAVVKIFPTSHAAVLLRKIMMAAPMEQAFAGAPSETVTELTQELGVSFQYGGVTAAAWVHVLVLVAAAALFFGLCVWRIARQKED